MPFTFDICVLHIVSLEIHNVQHFLLGRLAFNPALDEAFLYNSFWKQLKFVHFLHAGQSYMHF